MLYALKDGNKVPAKINTKAKCIGCNNTVKSFCGKINQWHWRHEKKTPCDVWYEPETQWHLYWKSLFDVSNTEVRITKDDKWHIADICTNSDVIIELQYSNIDIQTIKKREDFYGERMFWLLHQRRFNIKPLELDAFYIDRPLSFTTYFDTKAHGFPIWVADFDSFEPNEKLKRSLVRNGFIYDEKLKMYYKRSSGRTLGKIGFLNDINNDLISEIRLFALDVKRENPKLKKFYLNRPQKTWISSNRNIFIDNDLNTVVWIKSFKNNRHGLFELINRNLFVQKYVK